MNLSTNHNQNQAFNHNEIQKLCLNNSYCNELDNWFDELDDKTIEIINNNLMKEEDESDNDFISEKLLHKSAPVNLSDDDKEEKTSVNNEEITIKYINVDEIIAGPSDSLTSNELIHNECSIAYFIQVLMEGTTNNKFKSVKTFNSDLTMDKINSIIEYLSWISNVSELLANRIGQEILVYKNEGMPVIIRSSYNFCTKYTQCKNFYSIRETPCCKEHHYVHSLLKYDIDSVVMFLKYIVANNLIMTNEELNNLYLSIKTICFVARHMGKEISYIDHVTKNNSEKFHRNNPIDMSKKKIICMSQRSNHQFKNHNGSHTSRNYENHNNWNSCSSSSWKGKSQPWVERTNSAKIESTNKNGFRKFNRVNIKTNTNKPVTTSTNRYSLLSDY